MNHLKLRLTILLFGTVCLAGSAATTLPDSETPDGGWKSTAPANHLRLSKELPDGSGQSLLFTAPKWKGGESVWPAFENRSIPKDWSKFDRLAVPVCNDGKAPIVFNIFLSDSKTPFRKGAYFTNILTPFTARLLVLPLRPAFQEKKIDPADIAIFHCFSENPREGIRLFLGDITLLEPGEAVPELPESFLRQARKQRDALLAPTRKRLETELDALKTEKLRPEFAAYLRKTAAANRDRLRSGEFDELLLNNSGNPPPEWRSLQSLVPVMAAAPVNGDLLLGCAPPTDKVLPKVPVFRPLPETVRIDAARNERESFQMVVMPLEKDRKSVAVRLTPFTGPAGTLPESAVTAIPVGFVETTFVPKSGSDHVGFHPDPLLAFLPSVEVRAGDAQPFWIRADIPADQPAGEYSGKAEITVDGKAAFSVPVSIRVRDFTLPNRSMLPLAVTFWPNDGCMSKCNPDFNSGERKSPAAPVHAWKNHKKAWNDLLSGYYLNIDSLYEYSDWEPQFELLADLKRQGKLGKFNLGYFHPAAADPKDNHGMQSTIDRIRPRYEKAKSLGLLGHAYLYGCDEAHADRFPLADRAAAILKKEFPDVPIFTTAYDDSFGMDGRLGSIDWFCPLTPKFDEKQAAAARKAGKQVWWYICLSPIPPYANIFIESTGIETRLLMGAMAAKYRPDGFLYYQTSLWNNTAPITTGPYTDWIAHSFPGYNGDGNWTYPGPDGAPLGSVRLENFRDGLEDYAYVKLLEGQLAAAKAAAKDAPWQRRAEAALQAPPDVVVNRTDYTRDYARLHAWRSRLAELIESAPVR